MRLLPALRRNTFGRHARHDFGTARPSAYDLRARVFAERDNAAVDAGFRAAVARQAAVFAATEAPTLTLPVVIDAEIVDDWRDPTIAIGTAAIVQDGHYLERVDLIECDGGRPMHELDFAQVTGGAR
ncbi:hypothetical protein ACFWPK_34370 [Nocardia sp. NPDC058519]|uniref:hypothetical protein n=1 Tax=Nocardia sp. NPDC058519 TaxID=3346535 RepID=UPI00364D6C27